MIINLQEIGSDRNHHSKTDTKDDVSIRIYATRQKVEIRSGLTSPVSVSYSNQPAGKDISINYSYTKSLPRPRIPLSLTHVT